MKICACLEDEITEVFAQRSFIASCDFYDNANKHSSNNLGTTRLAGLELVLSILVNIVLWLLEYLQISKVMPYLLTPAVNKVPGFYSKGLTALANKPPNMQIFAPSKFEINRSADIKVMAKKF